MSLWRPMGLSRSMSGVMPSWMPQRRSQIRSIVDAHFVEAKEYVAHEARFLKEKPWLKVDGMTPEQAVAKLTELGWGLRAKVDEDSDD